MAGATPPDPGIHLDFLTAVQGCTYDAVHAAFTDATGALKRPLLAAGPNPGDVLWAADVPITCPACRLSLFTFTVLSVGVLQTDGTVLYSGRRYRLQATVHPLDGLLWADAVAA